MKFFEVFNIDLEKDKYDELSSAEVNSVNKVLHGGFVRVQISSSRMIPLVTLRAAEEAIRRQLLKNCIEVKLEIISDT